MLTYEIVLPAWRQKGTRKVHYRHYNNHVGADRKLGAPLASERFCDTAGQVSCLAITIIPIVPIIRGYLPLFRKRRSGGILRLMLFAVLRIRQKS